MSLPDIIRAEIEQKGAIGIERYMELALTHPEFGYYTTREVFGAEGDFTTAPEISQIFGEMIGIFWFSCWQNMGFCENLGLVEFGPGRGTLFADALRTFSTLAGKSARDLSGVKGFMVEVSEKLRQQQKQKLHNAAIEIVWIEDIPTNRPLIITANEFFDALPIKQFLADGSERKIIWQNDRLQFSAASDSIVRESSPATQKIIETIAGLSEPFYALFIDYGYTKGGGDSLQAVYKHQYADVLDDAGKADLTAHVDFAAIAETAVQKGAKHHGTISQRKFMLEMGAAARAQTLIAANPSREREINSGLHRLIAPNEMGELFKACCISSPTLTTPYGFHVQK